MKKGIKEQRKKQSRSLTLFNDMLVYKNCISESVMNSPLWLIRRRVNV